MDIKLFLLQELEKEKNDLINNQELIDFRKNLQIHKKDIERKSTKIGDIKEEIKNISSEINVKEEENRIIEEDIRRKEEKLYAKGESNFKELELLKVKIEELKEIYKKNEEISLNLIAALEEAEKEHDLLKKSVREDKNIFNDQLKRYKGEEENKLQKIEKIDLQIEDLKQKISEESLLKYKAMQKKYPLSGVAILEEGNKCSYCRLNVSVVKLKEVEHGNITYCESCSRLFVGKIEDIK